MASASRRHRVDLYCEDHGHELFVHALIRRLADEVGVNVNVTTRSGRGGHGRAVSGFKEWQRTVRKPGFETPDLLVMVIDGNCDEWSTAHQKLERLVDRDVLPTVVIGCPEPHVERWCIADPSSFKRVVGALPLADPGKCEHALYKEILHQSMAAGDQPILTDPMEFAPDLVRAMDLYRAGKNQRSLKRFVDDLRKALQGRQTMNAGCGG